MYTYGGRKGGVWRGGGVYCVAGKNISFASEREGSEAAGGRIYIARFFMKS